MSYQFGLKQLRVLPHNADHTVATPDNVFSSEGPWDFSGASDISAVALYVQTDAGALETRELDLSGVADQSAVTPAEFIAASQAASPSFSERYTARITTDGSLRVTTDGDIRVITSTGFSVVGDRVQVSDLSAGYWIQVFGEAAELSGFGQGFGLRWINCETGKSFRAVKQDYGSQAYTSRDAGGEFISMTEAQRLGGFKIKFLDTASDYSLIDLVDEQGRTFLIEVYTPVFPSGVSFESQPIKMVQDVYFNCSGKSVDPEKKRAFASWEYQFNSTKGAGYEVPRITEILAIAEYRALGLENY